VLTKKQTYFLEVYLTTPILSEACKKANISRQTYYTWLKNKEFIKRIEDIQNSIIIGVKEKLDELTSEALNELEKLLLNSNDGVKVRCISIILDNMFKIKDLELEKRIEKLEEIIEGIRNEKR
jgi:ACT domain-containing protein